MTKVIKELKKIYHFFLPDIGALIYGYPSRKITVIGVTGTKGKTSVTELINAGFEKAGKRVAVLSSIRVKVAEESNPNHGNSMPGRFAIQKFLKKAVDAGCEYVILEVTSEGVSQFRHRKIEFDAGVFINIHPEHIESHGSFEKYRRAKLNFFKYMSKRSKKTPKYFFVNLDDKNADHFIEAAQGGQRGRRGQGGIVVLFTKSDTESGLEGEFNKWNVGAAEAVLHTYNISQSQIEEAFEKFEGIPGRMETVVREPFRVVIDYAHTPDSLEQVYQTLSAQGPNVNGHTYESRLICVLGSCGGGRDKWKRPKFGEIASVYCKEIILTDEDPYDENPAHILSEIKSGISNSEFPISNVHEILDRKDAIEKAIGLAKKGDTVVITGKGSEKFIHVKNGKKIPWSDKETVLKILNK